MKFYLTYTIMLSYLGYVKFRLRQLWLFWDNGTNHNLIRKSWPTSDRPRSLSPVRQMDWNRGLIGEQINLIVRVVAQMGASRPAKLMQPEVLGF